MSRQIDLNQPLNEADRQYLLDRGREQQVFDNDARFSGSSPVPYIPGTAVDQAPGVPGNPTQVPPAARAVENTEDQAVPYEKWTHDALQEEIRKRNEGRSEEDRIKVSGRHAELVERLEQDDEDAEDEDEDEDEDDEDLDDEDEEEDDESDEDE